MLQDSAEKHEKEFDLKTKKGEIKKAEQRWGRGRKSGQREPKTWGERAPKKREGKKSAE